MGGTEEQREGVSCLFPSWRRKKARNKVEMEDRKEGGGWKIERREEDGSNDRRTVNLRPCTQHNQHFLSLPLSLQVYH